MNKLQCIFITIAIISGMTFRLAGEHIIIITIIIAHGSISKTISDPRDERARVTQRGERNRELNIITKRR